MKKIKIYQCEECGGAIKDDGKLTDEEWKKKAEQFLKKHTHERR